MPGFSEFWSNLASGERSLFAIAAFCAIAGSALAVLFPSTALGAFATALAVSGVAIVALGFSAAAGSGGTFATAAVIAIAFLAAARQFAKRAHDRAGRASGLAAELSAIVCEHGAVFVALSAIWLVSNAGDGALTEIWPLPWETLILAAAAVALLVIHQESATVLGGSVVVGLLAALTSLTSARSTSHSGAAVASVAVGAIAIGAAYAAFAIRWRHRSAVWLDEPEKLLDEPAGTALWDGIVYSASTAAIVPAIFGAGHWLTPIGLGLAAGGVFGILGRVRSQFAAALALTLAACAFCFAGLGWLPLGRWRLLAGSFLAVGWLLWIARFWSQQLYFGKPWTTAGALVEPARRIAQAAAVLPLAASVMSARDPAQESAPLAGTIVTVGFWLLLVRLAARDAQTHRDARSVAAAALVALAGAVPMWELAGRFVASLGPAAAVIAAGAWLAVNLSSPPPSGLFRGARAAYLGAVVPLGVVVAWALAAPVNGGAVVAAIAFAGGAGLALVALGKEATTLLADEPQVLSERGS